MLHFDFVKRFYREIRQGARLTIKGSSLQSVVSVNTEGDVRIIDILVVPSANRTSGLPRDSIKHIQHIQQRSPGNHGECTGRGLGWWLYKGVFKWLLGAQDISRTPTNGFNICTKLWFLVVKFKVLECLRPWDMFALYLHNTIHKSVRGGSDRIQDPSRGTAEHRAGLLAKTLGELRLWEKKREIFPRPLSYTLCTKENALSAVLFSSLCSSQAGPEDGEFLFNRIGCMSL